MRKMPNITNTQKENFFCKISKSHPSGCWEWLGAIGSTGYGVVQLGRSKQFLTHRVSYFLHNHVDPAGLFVLHKCDNPKCCNPDHLFLGTAKDNTTDMIDKGRRRDEIFGESHGRAKLTNERVNIIRELYKTDDYSMDDLANMFNIGVGSVRAVLIRKTWRHLK